MEVATKIREKGIVHRKPTDKLKCMTGISIRKIKTGIYGTRITILLIRQH